MPPIKIEEYNDNLYAIYRNNSDPQRLTCFLISVR